MDTIIKLILFFFSASTFAAGNAWIPQWMDGPAPARFESGPGFQRVYVDLPQYGGHATYTLNSNAPSSGAGSYFSGSSSDTVPKIASAVKVPVAAGVGTTLAATLTAVIPKAALSKAAIALVRANPYVSTALTLGWLANAGLNYFSDSDSFTTSTPTVTGSVNCSTGILPNQAVKTSANQYYFLYPSPSSSCPNSYIATEPRAQIVNYCTNYGVVCGHFYALYSLYMPDHTPPPSTLTPDAAANQLTSTPVSGSTDTASNFNGVIGELIKAGYLPDTDGNPPALTGPSSTIQGPKTTTTSPDGSTTVSNTTYSPTFTDNHVDIVQNTTNITTKSDGTQQTTTTTGTPPTGTPPPQTDCEKFPTHIGCAEFGAIPPPDPITTTDVPITLAPSSLGDGGSCPAPKSLSALGHTFTLSYQPVCDFATDIKPMIIALAWLSAGLICLGAIREV